VTNARGSVTAETALILPLLVVVLALALTCLSVAVDQVRCVDAARAGARAAARGDPVGAVIAQARAAAPDGSTVEVTGGASVAVVVTAPARWGGDHGGWIASLPSASATAVSPREESPP
jgi:Flp pilus assembly protein TadG